MTIDKMNTFCRTYDLIYVESGRVNGVDVYWFIDYDNERRYYTWEEILDKMSHCGRVA
jgi:hypothetical protein